MTVVWCYRLTIPHRRWNDFADFEVLLTYYTTTVGNSYQTLSPLDNRQICCLIAFSFVL
jgi:hypothetical protein